MDGQAAELPLGGFLRSAGGQLLRYTVESTCVDDAKNTNSLDVS